MRALCVNTHQPPHCIYVHNAIGKHVPVLLRKRGYSWNRALVDNAYSEALLTLAALGTIKRIPIGALCQGKRVL